jgi:hypothetical protein
MHYQLCFTVAKPENTTFLELELELELFPSSGEV